MTHNTKSDLAKIIYLHEVEEFLGGDALTVNDLATIALSNTQWHEEKNELDEWMVS